VAAAASHVVASTLLHTSQITGEIPEADDLRKPDLQAEVVAAFKHDKAPVPIHAVH
jgi:hypothetical protein